MLLGLAQAQVTVAMKRQISSNQQSPFLRISSRPGSYLALCRAEVRVRSKLLSAAAVADGRIELRLRGMYVLVGTDTTVNGMTDGAYTLLSRAQPGDIIEASGWLCSVSCLLAQSVDFAVASIRSVTDC